MASRNITLPVIDFSSPELKPGTSTWESTKGEVRRALEEFGCFHMLYDKIPSETRKMTSDSLPGIFDRPSQDTVGNPPNKFVAKWTREGKGFGATIERGEFNSWVAAAWPKETSTFRETMQCYYELLIKLDRTIRTMVLESLGLERYMEEQEKNLKFFSVVHKYPPNQTNGAELALPHHTDNGLVAILDQYGPDALEVLTKDGDQWISVNFRPNSFFVFLGDCFHAWTNGKLHQPYHRVLLSKAEERYSIGFFSLYKDGYTVKAPEELIDENHPQLFKPFDMSELLALKAVKIGYENQFAFKEYFGV